MKTKRIVLLYTFLFAIFTNIGAVNFFCRIHDLVDSNGLLESHMANAILDRDGFMWFSTWNGLVRYDGYNYYTFKPVQNSAGTISSNRIFNLKSNGSLKFEITAKRLYAASQRVL